MPSRRQHWRFDRGELSGWYRRSPEKWRALIRRAGRLAGRAGLGDERIGGVARDLFELALSGAEALGPAFIAPGDLDEARAFFETYTARSLSPADDTLAACTA